MKHIEKTIMAEREPQENITVKKKAYGELMSLREGFSSSGINVSESERQSEMDEKFGTIH